MFAASVVVEKEMVTTTGEHLNNLKDIDAAQAELAKLEDAIERAQVLL